MISNTILDQHYHSVKVQIQKELDDMETCALTTDGWTSPQRFGYLSLTVHFVDGNYNIKSRTLTIENITGNHTGEALQVNIRDILTRWNIFRNVVALTTDNGNY